MNYVIIHTKRSIRKMSNYTVSNLLGNGETITKTYNNRHLLHCENGPAVESRDTKEWWVDGKQHRKDGPAVMINRQNFVRMEWWENGVLHREQKPAVIDSDGNLEYWENGVFVKKVEP